MAPIALTSSLTSPPGPPAQKAENVAANNHNGLSLDGSDTPYSSTSTAVSEQGDRIPSKDIQKALVDETLPQTRADPSDSKYFTNLIASSQPVPTSNPGSTVYGSAIEVLEAFAVQQSASVWVYDDAAQVGFGQRALAWGREGVQGMKEKVNAVQTREGSGLELAGFARRTSGKISVFASTVTLPSLLPSLVAVHGDIVINVATTTPDSKLELSDSLFAPGLIKSLTSLSDDWDVVFSSGRDIVSSAFAIYGRGSGKVLNIVESTFSGRETTSYTFPAAESYESFNIINPTASHIYVVPSGYFAAVLSHSLPFDTALLTLNTLSPTPDTLFSTLTSGGAKTVTVVGGSKTDAEALKAVLLSSLYSASGSSKAVFPTVKTLVACYPADIISSSPGPIENVKTISFYTAPLAPLPQILAHLFLSSPALKTHLAQFGSASARGVKSVLSLSPSSLSRPPVTVDERSDIVWVSDANVLKSIDVFSTVNESGVLVLELPWTEEEIPVKLTRKELITIKEKKLRVFLLDLDPTSHFNPIREQAAFLLLYTGRQKLSAGVFKLLNAFHSGNVSRDEVEDAQAALIEVDPSSWAIPELEEGKVDKDKTAWEWDALPGETGVFAVAEDEKPVLGSWDLVARHLLFREAFAVPEAKTVDTENDGPGVDALRPSMTDETFLAKVTENRRLTPMSYDRNVFHIELDTSGTGLKYEIGEAIGIHGWNDTAEVLDFCEWYGLVPDALVSFASPIRAGTMETRTAFQLLQQNIDLFGRPGKAFYASLAKVATSKADAMTLKFISAPEGAELFKKMAEKQTVTFADVLYRFRTARPSIEDLVGLIPEIKPRHYSIASSQKAIGDKVELLIVTVDWLNSKGSPRFGQCTRYLAALKPGDNVTVSIKPSVMKLPPDDRQPVIMAGLGTGAAPFRAFMQHRAWQRTQGIEVGPLVYYFGSRYRSQEYLYGEEIEAYIASGVIAHAGLAFSRDTKEKVYIQHKMKQDKKMLADMLSGEGKDAAYFYLCGPTWPVPDVYEALTESLREEKGMDERQAEWYIEKLKEEESNARYWPLHVLGPGALHAQLERGLATDTRHVTDRRVLTGIPDGLVALLTSSNSPVLIQSPRKSADATPAAILVIVERLFASSATENPDRSPSFYQLTHPPPGPAFHCSPKSTWSMMRTWQALAVASFAATTSFAGPSRPDSRVARNVLEGKAEGYCSPSGPIESTHCLYETVESLNTQLYPALLNLVKFPFFRHYKVDLYRECPFWYENGFCMNRACGVEEADESEIPEKWRAQALSEVEVTPIKGDGISSCYYREQDFCYIEDDATQQGAYIDLSINPERFTGYAGDSAHHVWRAIYEENCFGLSEAAIDAASKGFSASSPPAVASAAIGAGRKSAPTQVGGWGFSKLSEGWGTEMIKGRSKENDLCEEKKVYYRVISGLHASISIHICHDYLNQQTGEWEPDLQCFITRLASHPERLSNVYFNTVLLLRAIARAAPYLKAYDIGTAPISRYLDEQAVAKRQEDKQARTALSEVMKLAASDEITSGFNEGDFFAGEDAVILREQFKTHFRNVSRIMDCVGCDKCRLWGKLQVSGLGTAMKILFELDDKALDPKVNPDLLQRSEVVALFNTLHRFSESLAAVEDFRQMYAETQAQEVRAAQRRSERASRRKQLPAAQRSPGISVLRPLLSLSAVFSVFISAFEAFRRSCRGCLEVCWKQIGRGPIGEIAHWLAKGLGGLVGRTEL